MSAGHHIEGSSGLIAAMVLDKAAQSSKRAVDSRCGSEQWLQMALGDLEDALRREMRRNPTGWHFGEWSVSFITDSVIGKPPIITKVGRA